MDQAVAHSNDIRPWHLRIIGSRHVRQTRCGLADDLDRPDDGELKHQVGIEACTGPAGSKLHRSDGSVAHMPEPINFVGSHKPNVLRPRLGLGNNG
jgi:hypothetical protein